MCLFVFVCVALRSSAVIPKEPPNHYLRCCSTSLGGEEKRGEQREEEVAWLDAWIGRGEGEGGDACDSK